MRENSHVRIRGSLGGVIPRGDPTRAAAATPSNDYPQQLRLACTAALYLCRKHTGIAAATIARSFNRRHPTVAYAMRSIERLLAEELILGELLSGVERELGPAIRQAPEAESPGRPSSRTGDDF
jgi:hypothetical protein